MFPTATIFDANTLFVQFVGYEKIIDFIFKYYNLKIHKCFEKCVLVYLSLSFSIASIEIIQDKSGVRPVP